MIMAKLAPVEMKITAGTLEILELLGRSFNRLADILEPVAKALSNTQPKTDSDVPFHRGGLVRSVDSVAEAAPYAREDVDDEPTEWPAAAGEDSAGETHNPQRQGESTEPLVDSIDAERWAREFITNHAYDIAEEVRDGNADGLMLSLVRRARDELRRERDNARQLLAIIGDERDKLNEHARDLQRQLDAELQPFLQANAQLREENARLVQQLADRSSQLESVRELYDRDHRELCEENEDQRRACGALEQQLDEARRERDKARALTTLLAEERNQLLGDRGIDPGEQQ